MPGPAVVNASPLIFLGKAKQLDVLRGLRRDLQVPAAVIEEIAYKGASDEVLHTIQATAFLDIVADVPVPTQIAAWRLGAGESAVLAQAVHNPNSLAVLDDREGRRCADQVGVPRIGTLGVIVLAKQTGIIPLAGPVIETVI